ncbi:MAG: DUF5011 domain-containing protein [Lachnospiraceae bacterium]|nr:DUF5011 domain-containing protein [Lachnospiraceae bacterium]
MKEPIANSIPQTAESEAPASAEETAPAVTPVPEENAQSDPDDVYTILEGAERPAPQDAPDDVYSILGSAETSFVPEPSADPSDPASGALPGFPRFSSRTKNILLAVLPALFLALLLFPFLSGSLPHRKEGLSGPEADTTPPTIMLTRDNRYYIRRGEEYEEEGYAAYDNLDGDLTRQVEVSINGDYVRYRVSDSAGNITVRFRRIPYRDSSLDEEE